MSGALIDPCNGANLGLETVIHNDNRYVKAIVDQTGNEVTDNFRWWVLVSEHQTEFGQQTYSHTIDLAQAS